MHVRFFRYLISDLNESNLFPDGVLSPSKALMSDLDGLKRSLDQMDMTLSSRMQETLPRDLAQVEAMVVKHKVCCLKCIVIDSCSCVTWKKNMKSATRSVKAGKRKHKRVVDITEYCVNETHTLCSTRYIIWNFAGVRAEPAESGAENGVGPAGVPEHEPSPPLPTGGTQVQLCGREVGATVGAVEHLCGKVVHAFNTLYRKTDAKL